MAYAKFSLQVYANPRFLVLAILGFCNGVAFTLPTSPLVFWLRECNIDIATIGLFSLVQLPHAFKFLWTPLADSFLIPILGKRMGRRRSWLFVTHIGLMLMTAVLGCSDPTVNPWVTSIWAVIIGLLAATQHTIGLAYQMESLKETDYGAGEASGIFGFRIGMITCGAGALYLAQFGFMWSYVFMIMGLCMIPGLIVTLLIQEPIVTITSATLEHQDAIIARLRKTSSTLSNLIDKIGHRLTIAVICPFADFIARHRAWAFILILMIVYRLGDDLTAAMGKLFYSDLGFSKAEIATATKTFGMWPTLLGGFIGGIVLKKIGILRSLCYCGLLHALTILSFLVQAFIGHNLIALFITVSIEHITRGMAIIALFSYQLTLCNVAYSATQLALLTSLVELGRVLFAAIAGWLVQKLGWVNFFVLATLLSFPGPFMIFWIERRSSKFYTSQPAISPN